MTDPDSQDYYDLFECEVARYLPRYYDENGHYTIIRDWSGYFDIGKVYNGKVLTVDEYLKWESRYLGFLFDLLDSEHIDCLYPFYVGYPLQHIKTDLKKVTPPINGIKGLSKKARYLRNLRIGQRVPRNRWLFLFTFLLREMGAVELRSADSKVLLDIGENYYIKLTSTLPHEQLREIAERHHLYLNPRSKESIELYKDKIL
ncbi:MAG: hypothetical protein HDT06_03370 [Bacteroidales bacterium]|nr:hypothetical protein [Bacteroidales bacterium]